MAPRIARRSIRGWSILITRLGALGCFTAGVVIEHGIGFALMALAVGVSFVTLTWRPKALSADGAVWTGSADLIQDRRRFPGQLSVTASEVVWVPTRWSSSKGLSRQSLPLMAHDPVVLQAGPALFDLLVLVPSAGGARIVFGTRRSRRLQRALYLSAKG